MISIYSYILRFDSGTAPNPFGDVCTLTICKPKIRKVAHKGDWIVGTGSKKVYLENGIVKDYSNCIIYAMEVTDIMTLAAYDRYCSESLMIKIPVLTGNDWRLRVGDCIYDYSDSLKAPSQRPEGVHNKGNTDTDLSGINSLISTHFYYFGDKMVEVPDNLKCIIKKGPGHKKIINESIIRGFIQWVTKFESKRLYGEPQLKYILQHMTVNEICNLCSV